MSDCFLLLFFILFFFGIRVLRERCEKIESGQNQTTELATKGSPLYLELE